MTKTSYSNRSLMGRGVIFLSVFAVFFLFSNVFPISNAQSATSFGVLTQSYNSSHSNTANQRTNTVSIINDSSNVIATIKVGNDPEQLSFDYVDHLLFVSHYSTGTISVINTKTDNVKETWHNFTTPSGLYTLTYKSKHVILVLEYVAEASDVAVVNTTTGKVITRINVGGNPDHIAFNPANNEMNVSNIGSETISVIKIPTNKVVAQLGVSSPEGIAVSSANNDTYVADGAGAYVSVISPTNKIIANVTVGNTPYAVAYDPGDKEIYVTNSGDGTVSVINSANKVVGTVSVGTGPIGATATLCCIPGDYKVVMQITNYDSDTVTVINGTTVIATIYVGSGPDGIASDCGKACE